MDRGPAEWLTRRTIDANPALRVELKMQEGLVPATYQLISLPGTPCKNSKVDGSKYAVSGIDPYNVQGTGALPPSTTPVSNSQLPPGYCYASLNPIYVVPCQQQAPPPPPIQQQPASAQPNQYFGSSYTSVPMLQPFPPTAATTTQSSLGSSLLELIRPITSPFTDSPAIRVVGGKVGNIGGLASGTQVVVTPINAFETNLGYNQPQTFPPAPAPQRVSVTLPPPIFSVVLEDVKAVLLRILEILRVR